jgi:hypothetical protein
MQRTFAMFSGYLQSSLTFSNSIEERNAFEVYDKVYADD